MSRWWSSGLTPLIGFHLQADAMEITSFRLAIAPLAGLQFAMLLAIEFPDAAGDAATGKRTLVVRHGAEWAARALSGGRLSRPMCRCRCWSRRACCPIGGRRRAADVARSPPGSSARMRRGAFRDPARWESLAFWSVALLVATSALELIGFVIARDRWTCLRSEYVDVSAVLVRI